MGKLATVYCLVDPASNEVKYLGQTERKLSLRLSAHLSEAYMSFGPDKFPYRSEKNVWIRDLRDKGHKLTILPVAKVPVKDKVYWEWFFGEIFASYPLLNARAFRKG